ncbi:MAG: hypothetical protein M1816_004905 [Peltula sp. TS41687]|nr:MAG: hypothetical protein M1816_004905 [Peltula sp. TS41687]
MSTPNEKVPFAVTGSFQNLEDPFTTGALDGISKSRIESRRGDGERTAIIKAYNHPQSRLAKTSREPDAMGSPIRPLQRRAKIQLNQEAHPVSPPANSGIHLREVGPLTAKPSSSAINTESFPMSNSIRSVSSATTSSTARGKVPPRRYGFLGTFDLSDKERSSTSEPKGNKDLWTQVESEHPSSAKTDHEDVAAQRPKRRTPHTNVAASVPNSENSARSLPLSNSRSFTPDDSDQSGGSTSDGSNYGFITIALGQDCFSSIRNGATIVPDGSDVAPHEDRGSCHRIEGGSAGPSFKIASRSVEDRPQSTCTELGLVQNIKRSRAVPSPLPSTEHCPSGSLPVTTELKDAARADCRSTFRTSNLSTPSHVSTPCGPQTRLGHRSAGLAVRSLPPVPGAEEARLATRKMVITELLQTEVTYYRDLKLICERYKGSISVRVMSSEDSKVLFGNLDELVIFVEQFYDSLQFAASSMSPTTQPSGRHTSGSAVVDSTISTDDAGDRGTFIGKIFCEHLAAMEQVYGIYLKNFDAVNTKLEELRRFPAFTSWVAECDAAAHDYTKAWSLDSLLVKPVQRLLKYPLLLKELHKYTPKHHPDYHAIEVSRQEIEAISLRINDQKRFADLMQVLRRRKEPGGLSKALKFKQHLGLAASVEDYKFDEMRELFEYHQGKIQSAIEFIEDRLNQKQLFVDCFQSLIRSIRSYIKVSKSNKPNLESKCRKLIKSMMEFSTKALDAHKTAVGKSVTDQLVALYDIYQFPDYLIQERAKLKDKYRARLGKPHRGLQDEARTYEDLDHILKCELPKLYAATGKLVRASVAHVVHLEVLWCGTWQAKLESVMDEHQVRESLEDMVARCSSDCDMIGAGILRLNETRIDLY